MGHLVHGARRNVAGDEARAGSASFRPRRDRFSQWTATARVLAEVSAPQQAATRQTAGVTTWIVDASNVIGSRPDGWWRDRGEALHRLVHDVADWRVDHTDDVIVVADGGPSAWVGEGRIYGVEVRFARTHRERNADDLVVAMVRDTDGAAPIVVTSDRELRRRAVDAGAANVIGAGRFRDLLSAADRRKSDRAVLTRFGIDESSRLGRGGEATVFALDDHRVLRVIHHGVERRSLDARLAVGALVRAGADRVPFAVPEVLDVIEAGDRLALIETRLPGIDALRLLGQLRGGERSALVRSHLDAAAALAALPCDTTEFGDLCSPTPLRRTTFVEYATAVLHQNLQRAGPDFGHVDVDDLVADLPPQTGPPVLTHLDAFLGNMLAEGSTITAVLDFGPTTIAGVADLDPLVAIAYLDPDITPTASDDDRATAHDWARENGLDDRIEPVRRWIAAYWSAAVDDERLHRWCRWILR